MIMNTSLLIALIAAALVGGDGEDAVAHQRVGVEEGAVGGGASHEGAVGDGDLLLLTAF